MKDGDTEVLGTADAQDLPVGERLIDILARVFADLAQGKEPGAEAHRQVRAREESAGSDD